MTSTRRAVRSVGGPAAARAGSLFGGLFGATWVAATGSYLVYVITRRAEQDGARGRFRHGQIASASLVSSATAPTTHQISARRRRAGGRVRPLHVAVRDTGRVTVRDALQRARADVEAQIDALDADLRGVIDASRSSNADDEHDPEGATIAFERAQVIALRAAAERRRAELDDALARYAAGDYGTCEGCRRSIPADRLAVFPAARTCVACASHR